MNVIAVNNFSLLVFLQYKGVHVYPSESIFTKASTTLSLVPYPEFMRDGGGAGLISISHFTTISANFRG